LISVFDTGGLFEENRPQRRGNARGKQSDLLAFLPLKHDL
jgi:hypothetical protein